MVVKTIKKAYTGNSAPLPKNPNLIVIKVDDIATYPARADDDISSATGVTGNLVLKAGAKAIGLYVTQQSLSRNDTLDGDYPATGYIANVVGIIPGDKQYTVATLHALLNEDLVVITLGCEDGTATRLHGAPCAPMALSLEAQDNNEAVQRTSTFKQTNRYKYPSMHYFGAIDFDFEDDAEDVEGA
ncbi:MAG: hypothetical protein LBN27_12270 [Prevotellaceae bacterium]|jgi:hypothetical protein|nr:hypothetical protein [Prevotellaceae bacterium]